MTTFYAKERAKYGNLTGQVIVWPVEYNGGPETAVNIKNLPAGYLKCDGSKYYAEDYPQLAAICGVGTACKFIRNNADGTPFDTLQDDQFMVPDLGSKYPEPTSGANAGLYNNIRLDNALGNEISRSGIGVEAVSAIGTTVRIDYSGSISVPSQEIPIRGKPSWSYAGDTHRTDAEGVEENAIHPHAHFHSGVRSRLLTTTETNSQNPLTAGQTGRRNASTIPISDWVEGTTNSTGYPGSGSQPCLAIDAWRDGQAGTQNSPLTATIYYGGCIFPPDGQAVNQFKYHCLLDRVLTGPLLDRSTVGGSADGSNTAKYKNSWIIPLIGCFSGGGAAATGSMITVQPTYIQSAQGVPTDFAGNSLYDVVPLQSNDAVTESRCTPDVDNVVTETDEISQTGDPTIHDHRIDIEKGDHDYKVKTNAIVIPPENLQTTMTIGEDSSVSIDSACSPFIIMEYLIKI